MGTGAGSGAGAGVTTGFVAGFDAGFFTVGFTVLTGAGDVATSIVVVGAGVSMATGVGSLATVTFKFFSFAPR